jgi:hypothetical protein
LLLKKIAILMQRLPKNAGEGKRFNLLILYLRIIPGWRCHRNNPGDPVKWAKWGDQIVVEGSAGLTATHNGPDNAFQSSLVTSTVEVGGADGVRTGYFEVELTQDGDYECMDFHVGMFRPGLDHSAVAYGPGSSWVLCADNGGRGRYGGPAFDCQGRLKVGDRVGVLVDLEEKEGRQGGSITFFVNGVKFGSGFESGVTGPLMLGVTLLPDEGQKVTLLPDAQRPVWF